MAVIVTVFQTISDQLNKLFGGDQPLEPLTLMQITARAAAIYLLGIILVRIGKSRLVSRATPLDILLAIMLGALLSGAIIGRSSMSGTVAAASTLILLHWVTTALACRSHLFGNLVKGHAKVLYQDGEINRENMRSSHISEHDLLEAMRLNANVEDLDDVKAAYKERNGEISVVKKFGNDDHRFSVNVMLHRLTAEELHYEDS